MKRAPRWAPRVLLVLGFVLVVSRVGNAQSAGDSFAELQQRLKPGETVFVTDRQGRETRGTVGRLSDTSLLIFVSGDQREIPSTEIIRIEKPDPVWNGSLIGGALLGFSFMGGAGASCSPHCARDVPLGLLVGAALGGFLGARLDRSFEGRRLVFGTPLGSPNALRARSAVSSFAELPGRVRSGDPISVLGVNDRETKGTFARASASSIELQVDGQLRDIPANEIRQIARRGSYLRTGLLIGAVVGATGGVYAEECRRGPFGCLIAAVGSGAIIGRLIPRHVVVYRSTPAPAVTLMPLIGPARGGVVLSVQF